MRHADIKVNDKFCEYNRYESYAEMTRFSMDAIRGNDPKNKNAHYRVAPKLGIDLGWEGRGCSYDPGWLGRDFKGRNDEECYTNFETQNGEAWKEGMDIIQEMIDGLEKETIAPPKSRKRRRRWSADTGDDICLDRMRAGQDFWRRTEKITVKSPQTVTLFTDVGAAASKSSREVMWRGAAAVVLTRLLENAGYRVELWAGTFTPDAFASKRGSTCSVCCLKRSADPVNVAILANAISGWSYRTLWFGMMEYSPNGNIMQDGLGIPKPLSRATEVIADIDPKAAYFCEDVWDKRGAVRLITDILERATNAG